MRARISSGDVGDVEAEHAHLALVGHDEPEQRLDHRALAGAVRAEQPDRASRERGGDVAQRAVPPVADADVGQTHHHAVWRRGHGHGEPSWTRSGMLRSLYA